MMPVTLTTVGLPGQPCEGLSQLADLVLFPNTQPLPHLLDGRHEPNCPKEWVPFLGFLRRYSGILSPGSEGVGTSPGELVAGGFP